MREVLKKKHVMWFQFMHVCPADRKNQSSKLPALAGLTTSIKALPPSCTHMWPWPTTTTSKLTKRALPRVASAVPHIAPGPLALSLSLLVSLE